MSNEDVIAQFREIGRDRIRDALEPMRRREEQMLPQTLRYHPHLVVAMDSLLDHMIGGMSVGPAYVVEAHENRDRPRDESVDFDVAADGTKTPRPHMVADKASEQNEDFGS